ncbi:unnamed protein product [Haemonchus placei]|uniref:Ovule protein n=1 Tax=Haemonchus placei TaxID=6290 RepID=A0A0N4X6D2_HAEPC|nr:unnamed protein product [Haemonchus placei]
MCSLFSGSRKRSMRSKRSIRRTNRSIRRSRRRLELKEVPKAEKKEVENKAEKAASLEADRKKPSLQQSGDDDADEDSDTLKGVDSIRDVEDVSTTPPHDIGARGKKSQDEDKNRDLIRQSHSGDK